MLLIAMTGCQDIFTYSVLAPLATSPADMTTAQLESYAEGALSSGDSAAMKAAYDALAASLPDDVATNPDLCLLATDLAIGGSGIPNAVTGALSLVTSIPADPTPEETAALETAITNLIGEIDTTILADSVDIFEDLADLAATDSTVEISDTQYTNAAAALVFAIVTDPDVADPAADPRMTTAGEWATAAGFDMTMLTGMLGG